MNTVHSSLKPIYLMLCLYAIGVCMPFDYLKKSIVGETAHYDCVRQKPRGPVYNTGVSPKIETTK